MGYSVDSLREHMLNISLTKAVNDLGVECVSVANGNALCVPKAKGKGYEQVIWTEDYCNNWHLIMPLFDEHKIQVRPAKIGYVWGWRAYTDDLTFLGEDENPLAAISECLVGLLSSGGKIKSSKETYELLSERKPEISSIELNHAIEINKLELKISNITSELNEEISVKSDEIKKLNKDRNFQRYVLKVSIAYSAMITTISLLLTLQ